MAALFAAACGQSRGIDGAAASLTFDDDSTVEITTDEVEAVAAEIFGSQLFKELAYVGSDGVVVSDDEIRRDVLSRLIVAQIATQQMQDRGGQYTDADIDQAVDSLEAQLVEVYGDQEDPEAVAAQIVGEIPGYLNTLATSQVAQEATALQIGANSDELGAMCARHILLETEDEAQAVIDQIADGGDFAELAAEFSIGPTGPTGGDLGCADPANYVVEFAEALSNGELNEVMGPVETEFGFHVIEITGYEPFDGTIEAQTELQALLTTSLVVVNTGYGRWDPTQFAVIALDADE